MKKIEELGYKFSNLFRKRSQIVGKELKKLNITNNQSVILVNLDREPGMTQNDLVSFCGFDKASISKLVRSLEDRELIYKVTNKDDRRFFRIFLTENGNKLLLEIKAIYFNIWEQNLYKVSIEEQNIFISTLDKILENINEGVECNGSNK